MRVLLHDLPTALDRGLRASLPAAGHEVDDGLAADAVIAGTGTLRWPSSVLDLEPGAWAEMIGAVRAAFVAIRDVAARTAPADGPGRIVVVVDPSTARPVAGTAASSVAGAFLGTIAQVAAAELADRGVTANVVVAGWTDDAPAALADGVPLGRLADAGDLTPPIEFLLSEGARFVTGATLAADGGFAITKGPGGDPLTRGAP